MCLDILLDLQYGTNNVKNIQAKYGIFSAMEQNIFSAYWDIGVMVVGARWSPWKANKFFVFGVKQFFP